MTDLSWQMEKTRLAMLGGRFRNRKALKDLGAAKKMEHKRQ
jgi:hypothetical protein